MNQIEGTFTVKELIERDILEKPIDGNHGSYHPTSDEYVTEGIPFVMASDIENGQINFRGCKKITFERAEGLQKGFSIDGDVLLTHKATIGRTAIVSGVGKDRYIMLTPQVTYYRIKAKDILDNRFLKYYFDSREFQNLFLQWAGGGSTRAYLGITAQQELPIKFPRIELQRKIVSIIDPITKKIALNQRIGTTLELIAKSIFKSWFVDFDPVHAKKNALEAGLTKAQAERAAMAIIAGLCSPSEYAENTKEIETKLEERFASIGKEKTEELKATASLFPSFFDDNDLPDGWTTQELGSLCWLNRNTWNAKNVPESVTYVDLANTKDGSILETTNYYWNEAPSRARRILNNGDTIIGTVRPGNRSFAYIQNMKEQLTASTGFAVLTPKEDIFREMVYLFSTSDTSIDHLAHIADGGAYPSVRPEEITKMSLTIPSEDLIKVFHKSTTNIVSSLSLKRKENQKLAELRDTLLPKLLSGEIELDKIQIESEVH